MVEVVDDEQDGVGPLAQGTAEPLDEFVQAVARLGERELVRQRAAHAQRVPSPRPRSARRPARPRATENQATPPGGR